MTDHNVLSKSVAFLVTRDRESTKQFYAEKLRLQLVSEDPLAIVFDSGGTQIRVSTLRNLAPAGYTVLGWEVPDIWLQRQTCPTVESGSNDQKA